MRSGTNGNGSMKPAARRLTGSGAHTISFRTTCAVTFNNGIRQVLEAKAQQAADASAANPDDVELASLKEWLSSFVVFVRLFDRAVGIVPQLEPRELERALRLLDRVPDDTVLRLFDLLGGLDDDDVLELVEAVSRLSPKAARRATKLMSGVVRTVAR